MNSINLPLFLKTLGTTLCVLLKQVSSPLVGVRSLYRTGHGLRPGGGSPTPPGVSLTEEGRRTGLVDSERPLSQCVEHAE